MASKVQRKDRKYKDLSMKQKTKLLISEVTPKS